MHRQFISAAVATALSVATAGANAAEQAATDDQLEEIIVTGVLQGTKLLEAPVAIATVSSEEIARQAPVSAADLLKNVPGVFVNSSLGEIRNVVFSRGVSANSLDAASGYYYVSLQEDGLPVTNVTYTNYGPDFLYRPDITLGRLEALRGGTANLTGPNAPGGIFNYISRDGATNPGTEVRARYGLEGDLKNPFYRVDAYNGGSLGNGWSYSVGGFYRKAVGARDPGYDLNKGGQVKANLKFDYGSGSVQVYAKYLDDHNGWFEFLPARNFSNPTLAPGVQSTWSFLPPSNPHAFTYDGGQSFETWDGSKLVDSKGRSLGIKWNQDFGGGWSAANNLKYSSNRTDWNTGAVIFPVALDSDAAIYVLTGGLFLGPGTYTFKDRATGAVMATVSQFGANAPPWVVTANNLPNQQVLANGVLTQAALVAHNTLTEAMDQLSITKKLDHQSFTFGGYYARSAASNRGYGAGFGISPIANKPQTLDITFVSAFNPAVLKLTDPAGFTGLDSAPFGGPWAAVQTQASAFFGHTWHFTPEWTLDWGVRYEHFGVKGHNYDNLNRQTPLGLAGGLDGDPTTVYDNGVAVPGPQLPYSRSLGFTNYTASLLRKLGDHQSAYVRYSDGKKAPDLDFFNGMNTQYLIDTQKPVPQHIQQLEFGYRYMGDRLTLSLSPFYSRLSDVGTTQTFNDPSGAFYTNPTLYSEMETLGVESDVAYRFSSHFDVHSVITLQNPQSKDFRSYIHDSATNNPALDTIEAVPNGLADNNPRLMANTSFNFHFGDSWSANLDWQYMGTRAANRWRAFYLPAFHQFNLGVHYDPAERISFGLNINNLLNGKGVMSWARPGGFFNALDRQGFRPSDVDPNATFSVVTIQPRAAFLTVTYKVN